MSVKEFELVNLFAVKNVLITNLLRVFSGQSFHGKRSDESSHFLTLPEVNLKNFF